MEQNPTSGIEQLLYVIQILFYVVTGAVVVLTYRNAKKGLLSPVHTKYQEHVIERLKELSRDLDTEFDPKSPNYWAADENVGLVDDALKTQIDQINDEFSARREEFLAKGVWEPYTHGHSSKYHEIQHLARSIRADPFLPPAIRKSLTGMLNARAEALYEAEEQALNAYRQELAKGLPLDPRHNNYHLVNNTIVGLLNSMDFNIDQVERRVEGIRLSIQQYLQSFAPDRSQNKEPSSLERRELD